MRNFLPQLIATITQHPRHGVLLGRDFQWSNLWVYNAFRVFEVLFGRRYGINGIGDTIRFESACQEGAYVYGTWESFFVHQESRLRNFENPFAFKLVPLPILATPNGITVGHNSIFNFAIAFVQSSPGTVGVTTSLNFNSPSVSGSNTYGVITSFSFPSDLITANSWNAVSATQATKINGGAGIGVYYVFGIVSPAAGVTTVNLTASSSSTLNGTAAVYSGAQQTVTADSFNSANQAAGVSTSFSLSTTTVADNAWAVGALTDSSQGQASSVTTGNSRQSVVGQFTMADNGPQTPAGSLALAGSWPSNVSKTIILMSIGPTAVASVNSGFFFWRDR